MGKIKNIVICLFNKQIIVKAGIFALFLAITILAPFIKIQLVTGTIVNFVLYISTLSLGIEAGLLIGLLPSFVSVFANLLPLALLPMIPYIILSNMILVLVFGLIYKKNFAAAIVASSFFKFIFLFSISYFLFKGFVLMMSWPQLATALLGGLAVSVFSLFFNLKNAKG